MENVVKHKYACVSDTHGQHKFLDPLLEEADFFIHSGDFTRGGSVEEANEFFQWVSTLTQYRYRVVIAGNHDFAMQDNKSCVVIPDNVTYLEDEWVELDGVKIHGSPVSPQFYDWAFMHDTVGQAWHFDLIPLDADVVVVHGPPKGRLDKNYRGISCGSAPLLSRLFDVQPKLCVFGHIHEGNDEAGEGEDFIGNTKCINASSMDLSYTLRENPITYIEI